MKFPVAALVCLVAAGSVSAELYRRAPDVLPGTIAEMRTPEYWIARMAKPDEIVLTPAQIEKMNTDYEQFINLADPFADVPAELKPDLTYWWPGHVFATPRIAAMTAQELADTLRSRVNVEIKYMRKGPVGNVLAVQYGPRDLDRFEREMAIEKITPPIAVRHGIAVRSTRLRNVPSFFPMEPGMGENGKSRWDRWTIAALKIAKPVTVFHSSRTGEYLFVLCDEGYGWVRAEDIAFGTEKAIRKFTGANDFVVCTGDRVQLYGDKSCSFASNWFGMGDRLPLASKGGRTVKIPMRAANGEFFTAIAWLAEDSDTHVGWLPYTRRNVITTALKLLDNTYDFSGAWFGRQHENTYRDIFAVFGFRLPWHGGLFTFFGHDTEVMKADIGRENQYARILAHEPFITLQSCGDHVQLFLGEYNGEPIVLDQHGYGYKDEDGNMLEIRRCSIGTMRTPEYFLTRSVRFTPLR